MCLLREKHYRFGKTGVLIRSPRFTEKHNLSIFACDELDAPDTRVEVCVNNNIAVPENGGIVKDDSELFYNGDECITVVRSGTDNRVLWKTETRSRDVFAEIPGERLPTLNTYEILRICDLPRALLYSGSVILHASFIEKDGRAILFSGDKQIGKSTQAALWHEYNGARIINGDRALLEKKNGVWYASGLPFCGTSGICENDSFPVQAVVVLSQNSRNAVRPVTAAESVFFLARQCTFERTSKKQTEMFFDTAEELSCALPFIGYACRPDRSSVLTLEKALTEI